MTLIPADRAFRHLRRQIRVFAETLDDASPAGIPANVHHRRKGPVNAFGAAFGRGDPRGFLRTRGVERGRLRQRNRRDGVMPVDDVASENQRNSEPAFLDGRLLTAVQECDVDPRRREISGKRGRAQNEGAETAGAHLFNRAFLIRERADNLHDGLTDFFFNCHAGEQVFRAFRRGKSRILIRKHVQTPFDANAFQSPHTNTLSPQKNQAVLRIFECGKHGGRKISVNHFFFKTDLNSSGSRSANCGCLQRRILQPVFVNFDQSHLSANCG